MKTAFINLSLRPESMRRQLPVGLAYVMTAVKKAGIDFDLIDMDVDEMTMSDLENYLNKNSYDVIALGCIVTGFKYVRQVSDIIKKINPLSQIIAGNSVATSIPEILLNNTKVDIAVIGEGDLAIVDLLKTIEKNDDYFKVKGIAYKKDNKIIFTPKRPVEPYLDCFGYPDWEIFNLKKYKKFLTINYNVTSGNEVIGFPLNTGRGCPYSCTFCYHVFKNEKYRRYDNSTTINEIKRLKYKYNANFISFWDELTFPNTKTIKSLIDSLSKLDFSIGWEAPCRAGLLKKEDVSLVRDMKASGCDNIAFSLENAEPSILEAMNKKITVSQFVEQAKTLAKGGITPLTSVIFGYPQETPESIQKTIDICEECEIFPSVGFLLPLPGTPIYEWAKQNGFIKDEIEYIERIGDRQDFHINLTSMDDDKFIEIVQSKLENLASKQGLKLNSVFKTTTYQKPKKGKAV